MQSSTYNMAVANYVHHGYVLLVILTRWRRVL